MQLIFPRPLRSDTPTQIAINYEAIVLDLRGWDLNHPSPTSYGKRWSDGSLRPSWEDLIGAGAVIDQLPGTKSPEAETACEAFRAAEPHLSERLCLCSSGRELIERDFADDVELAAMLNVSRTVPFLIGEAFTAAPA